jgi:hypothetical protein
MKNNVELLINESDFKPYYKVELYVSVEYLQDMQYSEIRNNIPAIIGNTVLGEIQLFKEKLQQDMKDKMIRDLKPFRS